MSVGPLDITKKGDDMLTFYFQVMEDLIDLPHKLDWRAFVLEVDIRFMHTPAQLEHLRKHFLDLNSKPTIH